MALGLEKISRAILSETLERIKEHNTDAALMVENPCWIECQKTAFQGQQIADHHCFQQETISSCAFLYDLEKGKVRAKTYPPIPWKN